MDQTKQIGTRTGNNTSRSSYLPNITSPQSQSVNYAQRYQHMTKIANYNQMNEGQIWKQYQKLRVCLKQLNQQVLYHMDKKASTNLYSKQAPLPPSVQATLQLLDQQRKTNQSRYMIFVNQASQLEQRVQHLTNKTEYLQDINSQIELTQSKIKQLNIENKDMKRRQKMISKDLLSGPSFLERLVLEQQALHYAKIKYEKYEQIYKQSISKQKQFNQKTAEEQSLLEKRISQYKEQQNYVIEEQNLQKFEQLQSVKVNLQKYENVYKRNYLMKLKELQNIVNSISKHDQIIQETQNNIKLMRGQIDQISAVIVNNSHQRRRSSISITQQQKQKQKEQLRNGGSRSGRKSIALQNGINNSVNYGTSTNTHDSQTRTRMINNDKNRIPPTNNSKI